MERLKLIALPAKRSVGADVGARVLVIHAGEVRFIGPDLSLPDINRPEEHLYLSAVASGSKVFGIPLHASRIVEIDAETEAVRFVGPDLNLLLESTDRAKYINGAFANDKLYCVPFSASFALEYDPATSSARLIGPDLGDQSGKYSDVFCGTAGNKIYCMPFFADRILEIDAGAAEVEVRSVGPNLRTGMSVSDGLRGSAVELQGKVYGCVTTPEGSKALEIDPATSVVRFVGARTFPTNMIMVKFEDRALMLPRNDDDAATGEACMPVMMQLPKESRVGQKLTQKTTKRVVLTVLSLLFTIPMFSYEYWFEIKHHYALDMKLFRLQMSHFNGEGGQNQPTEAQV